jgi:hypothetical protein
MLADRSAISIANSETGQVWRWSRLMVVRGNSIPWGEQYLGGVAIPYGG